MNHPIKLTTTRVPPARNSASHPLPRRSFSEGGSLPPITYHYPATPKRREGGSLLTVLLLALACFGLSPAPNAFGVSPAPDGGYSGGNTAEGTDALFSLTSGSGNTANGDDALYSNTTGAFNTANGDFALYSNTTGNNNAATGDAALYSNTTGTENTANGHSALFSNTTGNSNTANGVFALFRNTTGNDNTATGYNALFSNTTGGADTANGYHALFSNTTGNNNTANGFEALKFNTTGNNNTANGLQALESNTTGNANTANGFYALVSNTTGMDNTANGVSALQKNTTGGPNTATGVNALYHNTTGNFNTADGVDALYSNTTGSSNVALGYQAGYFTTGSHNIDIGNTGVAGESSTIRIGTTGNQTRAFIAGVHGVAVTGSALVVNTSGQLGVAPSSERFKQDIQEMGVVSEALLALRPVTFHYKPELDSKRIPQFGLVAEDVEKVNPDLVAWDAQGKPYTVRYEAVNAMLLNEFLKEHKTVQELKSTAAKQEATIAKQQKQIEALTTGLQKVSDQFELSKSASQMAGND